MKEKELNKINLEEISDMQFDILKEIGNTYVKMHEYNAAKRIYLFEIGYLRTKVEDAYILSLIFPDTFLKYIELLYEIGEYKQIIGVLKSRKFGEFLFDLEKAVSIIKYFDLSCDKVGENHAFTKQIVEDFETVTEMINMQKQMWAKVYNFGLEYYGQTEWKDYHKIS